LLILLKVGFEDIVLEESKFLKAIWENHKADSVLDTLEPVSSIDITIYPVHLAIALSQVIFVFAFEDIATLPVKLSVAVFLVSPVFTLELIANSLNWCGCCPWIWIGLLSPFTFAMLHAIKKLSSISIAIRPFVLSETVWIPVAILADVLIVVGKEIGAVSMAQACSPFSFISIAIAPDMHSVSVSFATLPLANVRVPVLTAPYTVPFLNSTEPFAVIDLAMRPCEDTLSVGFSLKELTLVGVTINKALVASAMSLVISPFPLVNPTVVI
jgi:hypothetical protein